MATFNRERAARILVDAAALGDKTAADKHGVSEKSVQRYRARLDDDPQLSALVRRFQKTAERDWRTARLQFLRKAIAKAEKLIEGAEVGQLRDVALAIKTVGELQVASDALNVDHPDDSAGEQPATDAGGTREGASRSAVH